MWCTLLAAWMAGTQQCDQPPRGGTGPLPEVPEPAAGRVGHSVLPDHPRGLAAQSGGAASTHCGAPSAGGHSRGGRGGGMRRRASRKTRRSSRSIWGTGCGRRKRERGRGFGAPRDRGRAQRSRCSGGRGTPAHPEPDGTNLNHMCVTYITPFALAYVEQHVPLARG